jgi:hypothetical protein
MEMHRLDSHHTIHMEFLSVITRGHILKTSEKIQSSDHASFLQVYSRDPVFESRKGNRHF